MAISGFGLEQCDPKFIKFGKPVLTIHAILSDEIEALVRKLADISGQKVDWRFTNGKAVVLVIGDVEKVKKAFEKIKPEHDRLYQKALERLQFGKK